MESLIEFYKVHYNFAVLAALILLLAIYLILKGNVKGFLFVFIALLAYQIGLKTLIDKNPVWFESSMTKLKTFDFVDYIWGGSTVSDQQKASEERFNQ